jgi:hypothetical protein
VAASTKAVRTIATRAEDAMTNHVARLYALAGSILALFLAWLGIASHPWQSTAAAPAPPPPALAAYQRRLNQDAALIAHIAAARRAAPPAMRVVTLPPLTTTRTS